MAALAGLVYVSLSRYIAEIRIYLTRQLLTPRKSFAEFSLVQAHRPRPTSHFPVGFS